MAALCVSSSKGVDSMPAVKGEGGNGDMKVGAGTGYMLHLYLWCNM